MKRIERTLRVTMLATGLMACGGDGESEKPAGEILQAQLLELQKARGVEVVLEQSEEVRRKQGSPIEIFIQC
jgi:hypothetical protein